MLYVREHLDITFISVYLPVYPFPFIRLKLKPWSRLDYVHKLDLPRVFLVAHYSISVYEKKEKDKLVLFLSFARSSRVSVGIGSSRSSKSNNIVSNSTSSSSSSSNSN